MRMGSKSCSSFGGVPAQEARCKMVTKTSGSIRVSMDTAGDRSFRSSEMCCEIFRNALKHQILTGRLPKLE